MRVLFVDVLRLLALLQMVNGHTLDAVLAESARSGLAFERYSYARGLVSVAFLVVAGISFYLTTVARLARHRADPAAIRKRLVRGSQIVAMGYLLQVRPTSVYMDPLRVDAALRALFRCEVLQCIGLSLLALELLALLCREAWQLITASGALAVLVFMVAPWCELASTHGALSLANGLLGHGQGSQFPLFPWSGYVFAGVVVGAVALPASGATPSWRRITGLLAAACATAGAAWVLRGAGLPIPMPHPASVPWFVLQKLAVICVLLALLAWLTRSLHALPRPLGILGSETLALFVFHLNVIYGGQWALAYRFGRTLDWPEALAVALFNIALTAGFGLLYHTAKQHLRSARSWAHALRQRARYASLSASQADCTERSAT